MHRRPAQSFPFEVPASADVDVTFVGDDGHGLPRGDTALDLRVELGGAQSCLRLPFTNQASTGWEPALEWFLGVTTNVQFPLPASTTFDSNQWLGLNVGRWFGTNRVWLEPRVSTQRVWALALQGEAPILHSGSFALAVSAGYSVSTTTAGLGAPDYRMLHGPEAALRFKLVYPPLLGTSGFRGSPQFGAWELILPVAYRFGVGTQNGPAGFTLGLGFAFSTF